MATLKDRLNKWNNTRSIWQKAGDIFFWLLLILLIIPGPRKVVATTVNRVFLNIRTPSVSKLEHQASIDSDAYNWTFFNNAGERYTLKDYEGEVVFLNFWATWCPPCIAELPEIEKLYKRYEKDVVFLLVSNENPQKVVDFLENRGYDIPLHFSGHTPPPQLTSGSVPTTLIISREGTIVTKKTGAVNWDSRATHKILDGLLN